MFRVRIVLSTTQTLGYYRFTFWTDAYGSEQNYTQKSMVSMETAMTCDIRNDYDPDDHDKVS